MMISMLTTFDNPYDPFDQYDSWYAWDEQAGYHTTSLLSRILVSSDEISDADQHVAIEKAIDEILYENVSGNHKRVTREV